ncbi:MAG: Hsp70 family protein [Aminivibrio sp.]|nr:Hsp70 family protein [Aminivibrio sp.]
MSGRSVLAADFGTTKTYFSKCPGDDPSPVSIDFGDGRDGIPSAILYRGGKEPLVGQTALDTYGEASPEERRTLRLRTNFKADLVRSEAARAAAADFLSAVLAGARKQHLDLEPDRRQVLFGVPSEADDSFRSALRETARRGGFGLPDLVDEPKGALLYHIRQGDISAEQALEGVLVADFGGGTCDFAFLEGGKPVHSWGDMNLGGRLFDDLFYQWLLDRNPGLEETLEEQGSAYFVQSHLCREVKEFFSRSMARDRDEAVSKVLPGYGGIRNMTWTEFRRRGSSWFPSAFLRREAQGEGGTGFPAEGADLFGLFRECLLSGLKEKGIDPLRITLVILAGGSSLWPFVPDILREELRFPFPAPQAQEGRTLLRSERPYAVISMGLALLPALTAKFASVREALASELPGFLEHEMGPVLARRCAAVKERILAGAGNEFFRKKLRPLLEEFRNAGGSLASLRRRLDERLAAEAPLLRKSLEHNFPLVLPGLAEETRELTVRWFARHGVAAPPGRASLSAGNGRKEDSISLEISGMDGVVNVLAGVLGSLVTAGGALLCGGSGAALVAAGPVGLAVGGAAGLALSVLLVRWGRDRVKKMAEEIPLPPAAAVLLMTEAGVAEAERNLEEAMGAWLDSRLAATRKELEDHVRTLVADELKSLTEIGGLRPAP